MSNKTLLIITDGIGHNASNNFNAFASAITSTYDSLFRNTPYSLIHTYGKFVGLPDGQMGNSEVGHLTIGAGRIIYQSLELINRAIKDESFYYNESFLNDSLNKFRFYGNFVRREQSIQEVLDALASTEKIQYKIEERNITIY